MGDIAGAGFLSHVPTIMLPKEVRLALNEGRELSLVPGLERLRREILDDLKPDTFVVFDTHWFTTVEFIVSAHERRRGRYTSGELPRGIHGLPYDLAGSPALAARMAEPRCASMPAFPASPTTMRTCRSTIPPSTSPTT